ncbi:MAG: aminotransferase class IV [Candidatus Adiutrix sp.]|jgi:branched-chain amino acid aminotransferase|nr:aminotransferase class IV [Candidatus Adiutrix sp.]
MPVSTPLLSRDEYFRALSRWRQPYHENYLALYSSQFGGLITDPALWTVPVDDHMVHRGDAVFEVFKCVGGRAYCLDDHLDKLKSTADLLGIKMPPDFGRIGEILRDAVRAGGEKDALVRLTVSRGPGGFTSNPYESPVGLLLVTVLRLKPCDPEKYDRGVKVITAPFLAKDPMIATMKTCSYIQNVLVKKAALDAGADYAVCFGRDGLMTESSTENIAIVTRAGELLAPEWSVILKGSTLKRIMALAEGLVGEGRLSAVRHQGITRAMVREAAEALISSTTTDVLPIAAWDGEPLGDGRPGPVGRELLRRLRAEYTDPASPWLTDFS